MMWVTPEIIRVRVSDIFVSTCTVNANPEATMHVWNDNGKDPCDGATLPCGWLATLYLVSRGILIPYKRP